MAKILFSLRNVPEDEADEVRALLTEHAVSFYETEAGNWGISTPAIWLSNAEDFGRVKPLLDAYQTARGERKRAEYAQLRARGEAKTWVTSLREQPVRFIAYFAVVGLILFFSVKPFIDMAR